MTATVTVRGSASAAATPDDASLTFTLSALRATPEEALSDVAERNAALSEILSSCDIAERDRITSGVSVREERDWEKDHYVHRGYRSRTSVIVRVEDSGVIGRLLQRAIGDVDAEVAGPFWRVADDNPAHTEARKEAIYDAKRRAEAYTEALGVRLGAVADVREPYTGGYEPTRGMVDAVYESSAAPRSAELDVEAGDLDVACSIDVVFRIEQ